jgi:PadR family transcriptional regulator, regulatory protein PadR
MTDRSLDVLRFFYEHRGQEFAGVEIMNGTGLWSGTMYVEVYRLEDQGLLSARWETLPEGVTRPRRRYYTLTPKGEAAAYFRLGLGHEAEHG